MMWHVTTRSQSYARMLRVTLPSPGNLPKHQDTLRGTGRLCSELLSYLFIVRLCSRHASFKLKLECKKSESPKNVSYSMFNFQHQMLYWGNSNIINICDASQKVDR